MSEKTFDQTTARWFKSTRSNGGGGNCVETACLDNGGMAVRDSKNPAGGVLLFTPAEWSAFVSGVKDGQFDL